MGLGYNPTVPLFRKKQPHSLPAAVHPDEIAEDEWAVSEGEMDGSPLIIRFNSSMAAAAGHPDFATQIGIAVPLRNPNPGGMPTPDETKQLRSIEDEIDRLVGGRAVMVAVVTTGEMREFVLYTGTGDWIAQFHTDLQAAVDTHEVQVVAQRDPDWNVYAHLAS